MDFFKPFYYGLLLFHFCNDWLTDWLTAWLAGWLTGWLTDWLTDWLAGWLADWLTGWLTDWLNEMNYSNWTLERTEKCCWITRCFSYHIRKQEKHTSSLNTVHWRRVFKGFLTLSWRRPLSHRNQSINLLLKSVDWFLYDNSLRHERVEWNTPSHLFWFIFS